MAWSQEQKLICAGVALVVTVVSIVLLAISFERLEQLDYGLKYNYLLMEIEPTTYSTAGLYFLGLGCTFIRYPKPMQTIQYVAEENDRLQTRTSDGLPVKLSVSFQWRYIPSKLYENYMTYKGEEEEVYENAAKATIANVATNFSAYSYFNDKQGIASAMQIEVTRVFADTLLVQLDAFQITRVELPSDFQSAILDTIQAKQNITNKLRYQENMLVTFATQELQANMSKLQQVARAHGSADQRREQAEANVQKTRQTVGAEMYAYGNLTARVGLNDSESLDYIWWSEQLEVALAGASDTKDFLIGVDPAVLSRR